MVVHSDGPASSVLLAAVPPIGFGQILALGFRAQTILFIVALAFLVFQLSLHLVFPAMVAPRALSAVLAILSTSAILLLVLVTYVFAGMLIHDRPKHPTRELIRRVAAILGDRNKVALGLPAFVSLILFIFAFTNVKANIPVIYPFTWDRTFDRWDTLLHFGHRPWEWLQPVLGYWPITFAINFVYNLWFVTMFGTWLHYAILSKPGVQRTRFFLSFMMIWMIGGGLMAIVFSSAGPCFYGEGRLGLSPDPYAGLMAYLRAANEIVPVWALKLQDILWSMHLAASPEGSISAMPSLHNGSSLLFALASRGWPRWIRLALAANVVLVFLGSVHLAWHYAVDAYVAWALTLVVWWAMGPVARWWEERPSPRRFREALALAAFAQGRASP